jgi:lysophospholipase L1-like esterase
MRFLSLLALGVTVPGLGVAAAMIATGSPARATLVQPPKSPPAVHYVALGDSYSSGTGADDASGSCGRSPDAYPALWAKAHHVASFTFAACAGATTADVVSGQLGALNSSTTLVSITIGGNDAGFAKVMETCVLQSTSSCEAIIATEEKFVNGTLPGRLDTMLNDIHAAAPHARVVMLDYPDFYDLHAWLCIGLSGADHRALDAGINDLDGVLRAAAARHHDTFADVRARFAAHEICSGSSWLHSVTLPIGDSYHPTTDGQRDGYLPDFTRAA